uniref:Tryptophan synthase alpha chain n=1 Tax=Plumaria plumosa TaxID=189642 RepID=A0A4D6WZX2_9FLOR|nr:Tryptophan synthase alpha subunit [Plumaria plumosa]
MNIISQILSKKRETDSCALIPFITAGYPDIDTTIKVLDILDHQGADIIELGIPYSDALADGPIIQHSSKVALAQGTYIDQVLNILNRVKHSVSAPIVIFTYYNPVLTRGISKFILEISNSGVKGLIIPDLPIEEIDYILSLCNNYNIELILFIAPTSSKNRISHILTKSSDCLYLVSSTGVTGTRDNINSSTSDLSTYIKAQTNKFTMIGFGISSTDQAAEISKWNIDGIVVGSAFIKILANEKRLEDIALFCNSIKSAIDTN